MFDNSKPRTTPSIYLQHFTTLYDTSHPTCCFLYYSLSKAYTAVVDEERSLFFNQRTTLARTTSIIHPSMANLFLLADHIKLSLLERQRAVALNLEPTSQDGHISRSLDSLREGLENIVAERIRLQESGDLTYLPPDLPTY